jgi:hypothetical protein
MFNLESPRERLAVLRQAIDEMVNMALENGYWPPRDLLLTLVMVKTAMHKPDLTHAIVDDLQAELESVLAEAADTPCRKKDPEDEVAAEKPAFEFEMLDNEPPAAAEEQPVIAPLPTEVTTKLTVESGPFGTRRVLRVERTHAQQPPCQPVILTAHPATETQRIVRRVIRLA